MTQMSAPVMPKKGRYSLVKLLPIFSFIIPLIVLNLFNAGSAIYYYWKAKDELSFAEVVSTALSRSLRERRSSNYGYLHERCFSGLIEQYSGAYAKKLGLQVDPKQVARRVRASLDWERSGPSFRGPYSMKAGYQQLFKNERDWIEAKMTSDLLQQLLVNSNFCLDNEPFRNSGTVEFRRLAVVFTDSESAVDVTEEDIKDFYLLHKLDHYTDPESVDQNVLAIALTDLIPSGPLPTEQELLKYYQAHLEEFYDQPVRLFSVSSLPNEPEQIHAKPRVSAFVRVTAKEIHNEDQATTLFALPLGKTSRAFWDGKNAYQTWRPLSEQLGHQATFEDSKARIFQKLVKEKQGKQYEQIKEFLNQWHIRTTQSLDLQLLRSQLKAKGLSKHVKWNLAGKQARRIGEHDPLFEKLDLKNIPKDKLCVLSDLFEQVLPQDNKQYNLIAINHYTTAVERSLEESKNAIKRDLQNKRRAREQQKTLEAWISQQTDLTLCANRLGTDYQTEEWEAEKSAFTPSTSNLVIYLPLKRPLLLRQEEEKGHWCIEQALDRSAAEPVQQYARLQIEDSMWHSCYPILTAFQPKASSNESILNILRRYGSILPQEF